MIRWRCCGAEQFIPIETVPHNKADIIVEYNKRKAGCLIGVTIPNKNNMMRTVQYRIRK